MNELRISLSPTKKLLFNTHGQIGADTSNEDLWENGWRIGFTRISKYLKIFGVYLFLANKET